MIKKTIAYTLTFVRARENTGTFVSRSNLCHYQSASPLGTALYLASKYRFDENISYLWLV